MKKQINMIMALIMAITSLSGCATATSSMSIDSVYAGNEVNEALMGEVTNIDLKEISIGAGLFLRDGVEDENKALIIEETAPVVTTTMTLGEETVTEFEETTVTTVQQTEISIVTDNKGQTVTDSKGEVVTSIVTNNDSDSDYDHDSNNNRPVVTTTPTNPTTTKSTTVTTTPTTTKATTTTTTTPVTTKATTTTTTTTPVVTEPELSEVERARAVTVDCWDNANNTRAAEEAFLTVLNDYRRANGLGEVWCDCNLETVEAWKVYFSRRFLRHLDRNDVIMHSVLGSRGVCGTTEIITVQKNSMTAGEALDSFIGSPDHNSALLDPEFDGAGVLITFLAGPENNNVYCLVNFCTGGSLGDSWYGHNIEDFEAFLSSRIDLSAFDYDCGDAGIKKEENWNRLLCYRTDAMIRTGLMLPYCDGVNRLYSWWTPEVEDAANVIFNGFSDALINGKPEGWTIEDDQMLWDFVEDMKTQWDDPLYE